MNHDCYHENMIAGFLGYEGLFGIGLLARMAGKARECIHTLRSFHASGMTAKLLKDCVLSPFVADTIALIDITSFEAGLATTARLLYVFLDTNSKDKANVALLPLARAGKGC